MCNLRPATPAAPSCPPFDPSRCGLPLPVRGEVAPADPLDEDNGALLRLPTPCQQNSPSSLVMNASPATSAFMILISRA
jgi:hypothetical protein